MGSLLTLGIYAALALGAIAAVWGAIHAHDNGVRNAQIAADTIVLNKVKAQLATSQQNEQAREAETAACVARAKTQSDAVSDLDKRGQAGDYAYQRAIFHSEAALEAIDSPTIADPCLRALAPDLSLSPLLQP